MSVGLLPMHTPPVSSWASWAVSNHQFTNTRTQWSPRNKRNMRVNLVFRGQNWHLLLLLFSFSSRFFFFIMFVCGAGFGLGTRRRWHWRSPTLREPRGRQLGEWRRRLVHCTSDRWSRNKARYDDSRCVERIEYDVTAPSSVTAQWLSDIIIKCVILALVEWWFRVEIVYVTIARWWCRYYSTGIPWQIGNR